MTKFSIKLSRRNDFEAGEYELSVKESGSGRKIGRKIRIKLNGKNKVINRGSLDFSSKKAKPAPEKPDEDAGKPEPEPVGAAEDMGPDLSDIPDDVGDDDGPDGTKVEPKQGGCGCEVAGAPADLGWPAAAILLGIPLLRRRRRSAWRLRR